MTENLDPFRKNRIYGILAILFLIVLILISIFSSLTHAFGWKEVSIKTRPPAWSNGAVVYDTKNNDAILFGGLIEGKYFDETWEWDGKDWNKLSPQNHPSAREKLAMAYDENRHRIVLFGGEAGDAPYNDTWEWDGNDWILMNPSHNPTGRCCHAMAYDNTQNMVILYGGWDNKNNVFYNDVWAWDGTDWKKITGDNPPPQMAAHVLINFSSKNEDIFNLTGNDGTWAWDGSNWKDLAVAGPPHRADARASYDSQYNRVIFYGGTQENSILNDTWVFNGTSWMQLSFTTQPPARWGHAMFYDSGRHSIILFGGVGKNGLLNDTWELNLPQDLSQYIYTK